MKKIIIVFSIFILASTVYGQKKNNALGLRFEGDGIGNNIGFSLKHKYKTDVFLEGIVHLYNNDLGLTGLYEKYMTLSSDGALDFFYGGGAGITIGNGGFTAGITGIAGLCYTFKDIPIDISLDWRPTLEVIPDPYLYPKLIGLSVRYTF